MKSQILVLFLLCLMASTMAHKFEANPRAQAKISKAFDSIVSNPLRVQRTLLVNPDPDYIKVNGNSGRVTITPHGLGSTPSQDRINLEWALAHFSDIKLQPGEFHIDRTMEIVDFVGTIKGSGKNQTFLVGRGPLVENQYEFPLLTQDLQERVYPAGVPHLLWFHSSPHADPNDWVDHRTDLVFRDLSLRIDGVGPAITLAQQPIRTVWALVAITGPNASYTIPGGNVPQATIVIKNVGFLAQNVSYELGGVQRSHYNTALGLIMYGGEAWDMSVDALNGWIEYNHSPINAQLTIENSEFRNFHQFGFGAEGFGAQMTGSPYTYPTDPVFPQATVTVTDNIFDNVGNGAGLVGTGGIVNVLVANFDAEILISDNLYLRTPSIGIAVLNGIADDLLKTSFNIEITNNQFHMIGGDYSTAAIFILDINAFDGPETNAIVSISDNAFYGEVGFARFQIFSVMSKGMRAIDNTFYGTAAGAIALSPVNIFNPADPPTPTVGAVVSGNDFDSLLSFAVDVFLGTGAFYCQVVVNNPSEAFDANGATTTNVITVA